MKAIQGNGNHGTAAEASAMEGHAKFRPPRLLVIDDELGFRELMLHELGRRRGRKIAGAGVSCL